MTLIYDVLKNSSSQLKSKGIETSRLDAEILLAHVLSTSRELLFIRMDEDLKERDAILFQKLIDQRSTRKPIAHILGQKEFWSLDFKVGRETLIPRPDSETLVETTLGLISEESKAEGNILDLGTGTGCLLISILSELPNWTGVGVDISSEALGVARENANSLDVGSRVELMEGDWGSPALRSKLEKFELIISNPPYIKDQDIETLMEEVKIFDPLVALAGGTGELNHYKKIIPLSFEKLNHGGALFLEIGEGLEDEVKTLLCDTGFENISFHNDLSGIIRVIGAKKPNLEKFL